jgi:hypothetical protein
MVDFLNEKVLSTIDKKIKQYHELFQFPFGGEHWENILADSLKENGYTVDWKPDKNHKSDYDMVIKLPNKDVNISCKSGILGAKTVIIGKSRPEKKERLRFSGHRTGRHNTIKEKIDFINNADYHYHLILAKEDKKNNINNKYRYILYCIDKKDVFYGSPKEWECLDNNSGCKYYNFLSDKVNACIVEKMSGQLWTELDLDFFKEIYEFKN